MLKPFTILFLLLIGIQSSKAQTNFADSISHQNLQRHYILNLPPAYQETAQLPLVIFLHGGSGSAFTGQNFTQFTPFSNSENFIIVYPQGFAPSANGGFTWADGRGTSADNLGIDDVGFIQNLIDTLISNYSIDTNRIYLSGFSNGGFMTQRIACEMNDRLAAIASLGSTMDVNLLANCDPERPLPTLILTGTADPFVPYEGGPMQGNVPDIVSTFELVDFWANNNQCSTAADSLDVPDSNGTDNTTVTTFDLTGCACNASVRHIRINNGGHTWPGVELPDYEIIAGETNEDIHASEALWAFFQQFERCTDVTSNIKPIENPMENITIFPNPTTDYIQIESSTDIHQIDLLDWNGKKLLSQLIEDDSPTLSTLGLPSGQYLLRLITREGISLHQIAVFNTGG